MKPRHKLAESTTPDGALIALYEHDGAYSMSFAGQELMHSQASASELALGELGIETLHDVDSPRIFIGGLGLGFTLNAVLAGIGKNAIVELSELIPVVVDWNRSYLSDLNGALLDDPRLQINTADAVKLLRKAPATYYDAILLDIDNGPTGMVKASNRSLYSSHGIHTVMNALKPGGRVAFWSAGVDPHFELRLKKSGFRVGAIPVKVHERAKRAAYMIYVGDKPEA